VKRLYVAFAATLIVTALAKPAAAQARVQPFFIGTAAFSGVYN
jgi:hypothetical protein